MRFWFLILVLAIQAQLYSQEAGNNYAIRSVSDGFNFTAADWPWWRGPERNGTADARQDPPIEFSESHNVLWKTVVAGRGHGSPTLCNGKLFLATSDEETGSQSVVCIDSNNGQQVWQVVVHKSGGMMKNKRATMASSSLACDGERVFVCFPNADALFATAISMDGEQLWQKRISSYVVHQGYGSSPALYRDMVIVTADNKGGGAITALERTTGEVVWERKRPNKPNYPSPILVHTAGKDQLIMVGCDMVVSYDPMTGKTNWETEGATTECVTSTLTDGELVYTSGGYPRDHMSAIRADGSAEVVWENKSRLYVPSLVIRDGYLFGVLDAGIATCWQADTGERMWQERLNGGFSSSPVLVGERIYISSEGGEFYVFKASPHGFELLGRNKLGDEVFASPIIVGSRIYHRVAMHGSQGQRREILYCIGQQ